MTLKEERDLHYACMAVAGISKDENPFPKEQDYQKLMKEEQDSRYVCTAYRNISVDDISKIFPSRGEYHYQNFKEEDDIDEVDEAGAIFVIGMWIAISIIFVIGLALIIWDGIKWLIS